MSLYPVFPQNSQVSKLSSFEQPLMVRNFGGEVLKIFLDKTGFLFGVFSNSEKDSLQKRFTFLPLQQVLPEQIGSLQKLLSPKMSLLRLKAPNVIQIEPKLLGGGLETEVDPEIKTARELFLKLKGLKKEDIGEIKQREIFDRIGDLSKALPSLSNYEDSLVSVWYVGKVLHMAIDFLLLTIWTRGSYENQNTRYSLQQKKSILDPIRTAKEILKAHTFSMKETVLLSLDMAETGVQLLPESAMKPKDWNVFINIGEAVNSSSLLNESSKNYSSEQLSRLLTDLWLNLGGSWNVPPDLYGDSLVTRFLDLNEASKKSFKHVHAILDRLKCSYTSTAAQYIQDSRTIWGSFELDEASSISGYLLALDRLNDMSLYEPAGIGQTAIQEISYWSRTDHQVLRKTCAFFLTQISLLSQDGLVKSVASCKLSELGRLNRGETNLPLSYGKWIEENLLQIFSDKKTSESTPSLVLGQNVKALEATRDAKLLDVIKRLSFCAAEESIPPFFLEEDFVPFRPTLQKTVDLGLIEENSGIYKVSKKIQDEVKKLFSKETESNEKALWGLAQSLNKAWNFDEKSSDAYIDQKANIPLHAESFVENVPKDAKTGKSLLIASIVFLNKLGLYHLFVRKDLQKALDNFKEALDRFGLLSPETEKEVPPDFILPKKQDLLSFFDIHNHLQQSGPKLTLSGYPLNPHEAGFLGALIRLNSNISSLEIKEFNDETIKALATGLKGAKLVDLTLESNQIGNEGAKAVAALLPDSELSKLDLVKNGISDEGAKNLADSLPYSQLTVLNLASNQISAKGIDALTTSLEHSKITELNLQSNLIGNKGTEALAASLRGSKITKMTLNKTSIESAELKILAISITFSRLTHLDLGSNRICRKGDYINREGIKALAEALKYSLITNLNLRYNSIDSESVQILATSLPSSKLTHLNLGSNAIGDEGAKAIANSLSSSKLTHLDLGSNRIEDWGARAIAKSLSSSKLTHLGLENTLSNAFKTHLLDPSNKIRTTREISKAFADSLPLSEMTSLNLKDDHATDNEKAPLKLPIMNKNQLQVEIEF